MDGDRVADLRGKVLVYRVVDPARGDDCASAETTTLFGLEYLGVSSRDHGGRLWAVESEAMSAARRLLDFCTERLTPVTLSRERCGPGCSAHLPLGAEELARFTRLYHAAYDLERPPLGEPRSG